MSNIGEKVLKLKEKVEVTLKKKSVSQKAVKRRI